MSAPGRRTLEKRVLLSSSEDQQLRDLVWRVSEATDCSLTVSHLVRSTLRLLIEARAGIREAAKEHGPLKRPPNANLRAQKRLETKISAIVKRGLTS